MGKNEKETKNTEIEILFFRHSLRCSHEFAEWTTRSANIRSELQLFPLSQDARQAQGAAPPSDHAI